jgi:hypothetical protein
MISRVLSSLVLVTLLAGISGCGRRVVVDPSRVEKENDRAWTVKSTPGHAPPPATR